MRVSKDNMIQALADFISNDIVNQISDKPVKMILSAGTKMAKRTPNLIDGILGNSMVSALLGEDEGYYCLDDLQSTISEVISEHGAFPITIPSIPLIMPSALTLGLTDSDFQKLFERLRRVSE